MNSNIVVTPVTDVETFRIEGAARAPGRGILDPITVHIQDLGGKGHITIECFGAAWSTYFGAIGSHSLAAFVAYCDSDYLGQRFVTSTMRSAAKREQVYVRDLAQAVIDALRKRGGKMNFTPWFRGVVRPHRIGVYQRNFGSRSDPDIVYSMWTGTRWLFAEGSPKQASMARRPTLHPRAPWRGLAIDPKQKEAK